MPIPQEKITLVGWASCPSYKFMNRTFARRGLVKISSRSSYELMELEIYSVRVFQDLEPLISIPALPELISDRVRSINHNIPVGAGF